MWEEESECCCLRVLCSVYISSSLYFRCTQRTTAKIKIFMEPMPNSNERSIQIIGLHDQIVDCTRHFLQEISKVASLVLLEQANYHLSFSLPPSPFPFRRSHVSRYSCMNLELQLSTSSLQEVGVAVVVGGVEAPEGVAWAQGGRYV